MWQTSCRECFHMTSRRPYWCPKTMKRRPCWCPKPILWELNSFLTQMISFVPKHLHRCWPREWKHSILLVLECRWVAYLQWHMNVLTKALQPFKVKNTKIISYEGWMWSVWWVFRNSEQNGLVTVADVRPLEYSWMRFLHKIANEF